MKRTSSAFGPALAVAAALAPLVPAGAQLVSTNVALNKQAFGDTSFGAPPSRGNDGTDGTQNPGNWTHADYPASAVPYPGEIDFAPNPFWQVDLGGSFDLTHVEIVDRVDCCDPNRLNGSTITFLDAAMSPVGSPVLVDGLFPNSIAAEATLTFDNGGAGWPGVAHIRVDGDEFNQYFQFSEFRAFADLPPGPGNVALGRVVTPSGPTWGGQLPEHLTDGDFNTQSHPLADFDTLGFTYTIDLGQTYSLESVVLHNRRGCCPERLTNYRVSLHDDAGGGVPGPPVWSADVRTDFSNSGDSGRDTLTADLDPAGVFAGRFIVIENLSNEAYNPQIAEVEAFTTDEIDPPPPPPGPAPNLATGKPVELFDFTGFPVGTWGGFPATHINDALYRTISHPLDAFSADYYYEVDLLEDVAIGRVELTGRPFLDDCCPERLEDPTVTIVNSGGQEVFNQVFAVGQITQPQSLDLPAPVTGRFVRVVNSAGWDYGPQIGDLSVFPPGGDPPAAADLRVTGFTVIDLAAGQFEITFTSEPGAVYSIWADSDLGAPWANLDDFVQATGTSTTKTFTDAAGAGSPARYYYVSENE
jgi:hypothetical protein